MRITDGQLTCKRDMYEGKERSSCRYFCVGQPVAVFQLPVSAWRDTPQSGATQVKNCFGNFRVMGKVAVPPEPTVVRGPWCNRVLHTVCTIYSYNINQNP